MNYNIFTQRAIEKHNNKYTYTKFENISSNKNVEIICPTHGTFQQKIKTHLRGSGCAKCAKERNKENKKSKEYYISKITKAHGNKYEYVLNDEKSFDKIKVICPIHGEFIISLSLFSSGKGCQKCSTEKMAKDKRKLFESFGYNLVIMWESDWDNASKDIKQEKKTKIEFL
jgi:hypothetical protein